MVPVLDFLASQATVTAIYRPPFFVNGVLAIECLGQRPRDGLQALELIATEQVSVSQTPAFQGTLEQLHALLGFWETAKRHRPFNLGNRTAPTTHFRLSFTDLALIPLSRGLPANEVDLRGSLCGREPDLDRPRGRRGLPVNRQLDDLPHPLKPPLRAALPAAGARIKPTCLSEAHFHLFVEHIDPFFFATSYPPHLDKYCPSDHFIVWSVFEMDPYSRTQQEDKSSL
jgi:hypothetical protein